MDVRLARALMNAYAAMQEAMAHDRAVRNEEAPADEQATAHGQFLSARGFLHGMCAGAAALDVADSTHYVIVRVAAAWRANGSNRPWVGTQAREEWELRMVAALADLAIR